MDLRGFAWCVTCLGDDSVTIPRSICPLLVAVASLSACATAADIEIDAFIDNSKADGHHLKLYLTDHHKLDIDEPSDLAIFGGRLFTVSDRHSNVYEIDRDGDRLDKIGIKGDDVEAVAFDPEGHLFIADESTAKIWQIDPGGARVGDPIELDDAEDGNSGLEGLAFDDRGHMFAAKEKNPARLYELDADYGLLDDHKVKFADDLSALAFDPIDGHLYALSDQDRTLFRLQHDLDVDKAWKLPIENPEGIAFDGDTLYVVSDSEGKLYELEIDRGH